MGAGTATTQNNTSTSAPAYLQPYLQQGVTEAARLYNSGTGYNANTTSSVTPFSNQTMAARAQIAKLAQQNTSGGYNALQNITQNGGYNAAQRSAVTGFQNTVDQGGLSGAQQNALGAYQNTINSGGLNDAQNRSIQG